MSHGIHVGTTGIMIESIRPKLEHAVALLKTQVLVEKSTMSKVLSCGSLALGFRETMGAALGDDEKAISDDIEDPTTTVDSWDYLYCGLIGEASLP